MRGTTNHGLLGLGKVVGGIAVEHKLAERRDGHRLDRHQLGGIQQVVAKAQHVVLFHDLHAHLPLGEVATGNGVKQVLAVVVGVLAGQRLRLGPRDGRQPLLGREVVLDQLGGAIGGDEAEGVDAEAIDVPVAAWDAVPGQRPHQRVHGRRVVGEEVPGRVVGRSRLRHLVVRPRLDGMY